LRQSLALKLVIFLLQPPQYWDYRHTPPHLITLGTFERIGQQSPATGIKDSAAAMDRERKSENKGG
jgi:hypothetical protein